MRGLRGKGCYLAVVERVQGAGEVCHGGVVDAVSALNISLLLDTLHHSAVTQFGAAPHQLHIAWETDTALHTSST